MDGKWTRGRGRGQKKAEKGWTSFVQAPFVTLFGLGFIMTSLSRAPCRVNIIFELVSIWHVCGWRDVTDRFSLFKIEVFHHVQFEVLLSH